MWFFFPLRNFFSFRNLAKNKSFIDVGGSTMSVLNQLASALGRRDELPNQELARALVRNNDLQGIAEICQNLLNKDKFIKRDCIKVLYEIG